MPIDTFWLPLLIKAVATALLVVTASVAAEKAGPFWGGLIACLPISVGPAYVLLAMTQPAEFISGGALTSYAAGMATWPFLCLFVHLAKRWTLWPSLFVAIALWVGIAVMVRQVPWTLTTATLGNAAAFLFALRFTPVVTIDTAGATLVRRWYELPARGILVGLFVAVVVTVSDAIGPAATGLAAVFPIAMTSLAVAIHRSFGIRGAAAALSSAVRPLIGIVAGLAAVHVTVPAWGEWPGLACGLIVSFLWPAFLVVMRQRTA